MEGCRDRTKQTSTRKNRNEGARKGMMEKKRKKGGKQLKKEWPEGCEWTEERTEERKEAGKEGRKETRKSVWKE